MFLVLNRHRCLAMNTMAPVDIKLNSKRKQLNWFLCLFAKNEGLGGAIYHWMVSVFGIFTTNQPQHVSILTHWRRVTHICVSKTSPGRRQAIIWTNAGILLNGTLGANFSEISFRYHSFSSKKIHLKKSSWKWRLSCLGLNVLIVKCFGTS